MAILPPKLFCVQILFFSEMPRNSKRKAVAPARFIPATARIDIVDESSEELPSEVSSDCEICEIDISSDSGMKISLERRRFQIVVPFLFIFPD